MPNQILTLRRKKNETSEICIDFSVCYNGILSSSNGNNKTYAVNNGSGASDESSHAISICYQEDANNKATVAVSEDGQLRGTIVIEDSDVDSIVIEDSDVDFIVIEDSDVDFIKISIPVSKDTLNITSTLLRNN